MQIRPYETADAERLCALFFDAIRETGRRNYSAQQVEAWAPCRPDPHQFDEVATDGRILLVVVNNEGDPIAYGDLEADGHIDHLFCRPDVVGTGVASALYDELEKVALERGMTRLYVEASEAARPLFARKDFALLERRDFQLRGVLIHNYAMAKTLGPEE
ncbi:GNAT family N-acetyltransferase [Rhodospirillaceae bacterium SYSU D60014]|uniref:GNAT family N-acetyltransferase n=1 Tax=Virgifigura deserti TaxID=2268457 RepID=UPI000E667C10